MSDVILYAAIKENERLNQELLEFCLGGGRSLDYSQPAPKGWPYQTGGADGNNFSACPDIVQDWVENLCPLVCPAQSNGFQVCGNCWRCGANCTWCVPAGVSNVQVQMWGPGAGTSGNCCCGGSPYGPSGAYMVLQFCVNQGECYCFCSGCAYCCWGEQTTPGICGSPTWFKSDNSGIQACADSGISCYCFWNDDLQSNSGCGDRVPDPDQAGGSCSANRCSGWNFCYDSGDDQSRACHAFASRTTFHLTSTPTDGREVTYYGLNGLWPAHCVGGSGSCLHLGSGFSTPVFGFEQCVCPAIFTGSATTYNNAAGCWRSGPAGYLRIPGAGGYYNYTCAGQNGCQGDSGRFGMICVSWECS